MAVTITKPASGATLAGTVSVEATFSGQNFDIATVTFNGQQLGSDSAQPIVFSVDTTKVVNGARTLTVAVRYRTASGKLRWQKTAIPVTVNNAVTPPPAKPGVPAGFSASASGSSAVQLIWSARPASEGVDRYQVYLDGNNHNLNVVGTSSLVSGLAAGSTHTFRVSAHNSMGYGDWTDPALSVTLGGAPPPPLPPNVARSAPVGVVSS